MKLLVECIDIVPLKKIQKHKAEVCCLWKRFEFRKNELLLFRKQHQFAEICYFC